MLRAPFAFSTLARLGWALDDADAARPSRAAHLREGGVHPRLLRFASSDFALADFPEMDCIIDELPRILLHSDWTARGRALCVSKSWCQSLLNGDFYWRWLCERLQYECGLYIPSGKCLHADGWRSYFLEQWKRRNLWVAGAPIPESRFSISVGVRFRPAVMRAERDISETVKVPLHQRVAMVKASHGCSHKAALRLAMADSRKAASVADAFEVQVAASAKPSEDQLLALQRKQELAAAAVTSAVASNNAVSAAARRMVHAGQSSRPAAFAVSATFCVLPSKGSGSDGEHQVLMQLSVHKARRHKELSGYTAGYVATSTKGSASHPAVSELLEETSEARQRSATAATAAQAKAREEAAAEVARLSERGATAGKEQRTAILSMDAATGEVLTMAPGCGLRAFTFERVFDMSASQDDVYESCARASVADLFNGMPSCVFVYGQTGAGKTFTMFGEGAQDERLPHKWGVVPRACEEVLRAAAERATIGVQSDIAVAFVEIFGSDVTDLLANGANIGANEAGADNFFHAHRWVLEGRADVPISTMEGALQLLRQGEACKRRAATAMNERSSRAHSLFIITLTQTRGGVENKTRLILADLGGSEKLTRSDVAADFKAPVVVIGDEEVSRISWAEYYQHRARLQESLNINIGLYALQRCIEALLYQQKHPEQTVHVPFADSKLTLLLKDALGGGTRTTVLICASLQPADAGESIQSLRFGEACSRVATRAARAADGTAALKRLLQSIDTDIAECQRLIERDQRWEQRVATRYDEVQLMDNFASTVETDDVEDLTAGVMVVKQDDGQGRTETVAHEVVSHVLVGAEEHEARLEMLLQRRRELTGAA